jgi:D-alanine transaminase
MIAYFNGEYVEKERVHISPDDRGFLFSDGIYEVVRFYRGVAFRIKEHRSRMESGARALRFNRTRFPEFVEVASQLTAKSGLTEKDSSIVYFQVTRGVAPRSHSFPAQETPLTIYACAQEIPWKTVAQQTGGDAITAEDNRWSNCDIKSISLLPNTLAHQLAKDREAIEAIFVRHGAVQEGTHSNVFILSKGLVKTPPLNRYVLPGITRKTVIELCETLSIPCIEHPILKADLIQAEEVFIAGTTSEITPIICIDGIGIGNRHPGHLTRSLQNAFAELTRRG